MQRSCVWVVPGLALILTACTAQAQPRIAPDDLRRRPDIDLSQACPGTRWVAVLRASGKTCPPAPGFQTCRVTDAACRVRIGVSTAADYEAVKPDPEAEKARTAALRASGLDRVCVYDAPEDSSPSAPRLPSSLVLKLDKDCRSSATLGSDLEAMTWEPLRTQFLQQSGRAAFTPKEQDRKVRLAIVDTQPTGEGAPKKRGCSPHGYTLAHMAQNLVCANPGQAAEGCAARVTTRLALRIKSKNRGVIESIEPCDGGLVGWIGDLAPAILDEVDAWSRKKDADRLILNLSVGWDPQLFGGLKETSVDSMPAQVQSVYRALDYAARRSVLSVAAAGNATPGPTPHEGPILPAAWEGWLPGTGFSQKANPRPLIYAVGGSRWNSTPLPNSRPKATPPRVAYADHGVVADPAAKAGPGKRPTATLTGTSVSAVVVSSAAALAWADKPGLTPAELMHSLETDRGFPVEMTATFGTQPGTKARRICIGGPSSCRGEKESFSFAPSLDSFAAPTFDASVLVASPPPPPCKASRALKRPSAPPPTSFCPCDQFESAKLQPWVEPQPDDDPCLSCTLRPTGPPGGSLQSLFPPLAGAFGLEAPSTAEPATLYIDIPDSWWAGSSSLEATTLEVAYSNGDQPAVTTYSYSLNQTFSKGGPTSLKVSGFEVPPLVNPRVRSATLNFLVERNGQKMSVSSPLFFSP